ncbi:UDP-glucose dehydrogenase family protein [Litorimonas sp. RW-G-Af-16]|uniref:UDP-glucose dehydrogenase family protein n=1 Tax=Litorimonas sp. RW-G-Af-16 TaxID=3241168 RepID=UPI00390C7370
MRITMVGTGYVGLVSGVCFADFGHDVVCVDKDAKKVETLKAGGIPIFEPGLEDLVRKNVKSGRLNFTTDLAEAMEGADAVFIAVGTPMRRGDGFADLTYVYAATKEIAALIKGYTVVVTKSTVPVGTGDRVEEIIREVNPSAKFDVVSNPEFLREGAAINDFKRPDRVVVGTDSAPAKAVMRELYRPLFINETPIMFTSRRTSELTKYAANAFLAMKITFINEMADLCEAVGANVQEVARGIGLDKRIGSKFLHAGPGYGGSCFPKDTLAIIRTAEEYDVPLRLISTTADVNEARKTSMASKVVAACGGSVDGKTIAVLGLAFKPNTDDMRDSPSIAIIETLQAQGAIIRATDPEAVHEAKEIFKDVTYCEDAYTCAKNADALVIVTEWDQFRALDFARLKSVMQTPVMVDLRNVYQPDDPRLAEFKYDSVGRGAN